MISQSVILLSGAILIALSSGTIYVSVPGAPIPGSIIALTPILLKVFSAYGPQLAAKFALSSYQLNLLGGAGNAGRLSLLALAIPPPQDAHGHTHTYLPLNSSISDPQEPT